MKKHVRFLGLILLTVSAIVLCSCNKDDASEDSLEIKESWVEFAGEKYYYFFSREVFYMPILDKHNWFCEFIIGKSGADVGNMKIIHLENWSTSTGNPNGRYRLTSSNDEINEAHFNGDFTLCGPNCRIAETVMFNGTLTTIVYDVISGMLDVNKNGNIWIFKINGVCKDPNGNTKPFSLDYIGEVTFVKV